MGEPSPNIPVGWYNEAQFTRPSDICPRPDWWHTRDIQSTEVEVIEMVHGLIRGLQPDLVIETGTSRGFMAAQIGDALVSNGHGHLHTFEPDPTVHAEAVKRVGDYRPVTLHNEPSMNGWEPDRPIDFAWFDSLLNLRVAEYEHYQRWMRPGSVVGFHDTAAHFGNWSEPLDEIHTLEFIELPTPRGVILGRVA